MEWKEHWGWHGGVEHREQWQRAKDAMLATADDTFVAIQNFPLPMRKPTPPPVSIIASLLIPTVAEASSRGSFGTKTGAAAFPTSPSDGICASSVIVHGYQCQEHNVTTADGYILSVQRIPQGRGAENNRGNGNTKQPVILQHGVLADGRIWLLNSPEQNLPLILADNGFDVWIANTRGTTFSRNHTSMDPSQPAYWIWTWDELASYDLPAVLDYVSSQTGGQKIHYVGHSLGTLMALASFSEGKLVNQVKSAALLSPIAYLSHMNSKLIDLAARFHMDELLRILGLSEFIPKGLPVQRCLRRLCALPGINCNNLLTALTGENCCLNSSAIDLFLINGPLSTSTRNLIHLAQVVRSGVLAKFKHFGQLESPIYNLSNIPQELPLFISYGGQDALSDVNDVGTLLDYYLKIHDDDKHRILFIKDYAHFDFVMGVNAKDIVYNEVVSFFNRQFN
ncbi:hypothetical protein PIB30_013287 [Stylosanthes scabra]|uniref:Partial AB-hydrolase lipase domain-containing protein n=1 Tax=Stylosanthes scabra TaxID=79078 RepID=A0ABU6S6K2_9FABA|nr:hypothetical protein [Stylosanthes scabra]